MIGDAAAEVGPALFFSLLIITLSFIPVFTLEAQEGRLFKPLAYTRPMRWRPPQVWPADSGANGLSDPDASGPGANPLNRFLIAAYRPALNAVLRAPKLTWSLQPSCSPSVLLPLRNIGEFMPRLDEGDLLYMPSALPGCRLARRRNAATDRPADQNPARGGARVRQGRPRRDRHRPGAAGNVRDDSSSSRETNGVPA